MGCRADVAAKLCKEYKWLIFSHKFILKQSHEHPTGVIPTFLHECSMPREHLSSNRIILFQNSKFKYFIHLHFYFMINQQKPYLSKQPHINLLPSIFLIITYLTNEGGKETNRDKIFLAHLSPFVYFDEFRVSLNLVLLGPNI